MRAVDQPGMDSLVVVAGVVAFAIGFGALITVLVRREEERHGDAEERARAEARLARRAERSPVQPRRGRRRRVGPADDSAALAIYLRDYERSR